MTIGISIGENEPDFLFEFDTYHTGNKFGSEYGGYVNEYVGVQGGGSLGSVVEFIVSRNINKPSNIAYKFGISIKNIVDNTIYYSRPITIRV